MPQCVLTLSIIVVQIQPYDKLTPLLQQQSAMQQWDAHGVAVRWGAARMLAS